ncbi:MAG: hypothetical protein M1816_008061 [Peltula sp. TS41687]|nr:MAG: hypothetical protein M1816_008061 [Peltula sp. TS41687]
MNGDNDFVPSRARYDCPTCTVREFREQCVWLRDRELDELQELSEIFCAERTDANKDALLYKVERWHEFVEDLRAKEEIFAMIVGVPVEREWILGEKFFDVDWVES